MKRCLLKAIFCLQLLALAACNFVPSLSMPKPTPTPPLDPVVLGPAVFQRVCAQCHGDNAEGYANELAAPALDATEHASHHPDQQIYDWIVNGKFGLGRQMLALGDQLSETEIRAVIVYLHTLWTPEQLEVQQNITSRWPTTPEPNQKNP